MNANYPEMKDAFLQKQQTLENARKVLKQEFIGIDDIIDEIIDNVSSWYFLPELQEKPVVINLWGLTGVGKTSLVNRLAQLIDFESYFYRFDLGEKEGNFSFRDSLDDLCEGSDSFPVIIALDEFQHTRTISGHFRQEIKSDKNRMIWELIDSGKIQYITWKSRIWAFERVIHKLEHLLEAGVQVKNGIVVRKADLYCKEMEISIKEGEKVPFVPKDEYSTILNYAGKKLGLYLNQDVEKVLASYSVTETLHFLKKVFKIGKRPDTKYFTKALIFVLGNLDEAYAMSNNLNADIDADEFNRLSLKITVPQIKKALQNRFRDEQIARLGNIHIIYPALDKASYRKIIQIQLKKYAQSLKQTFSLDVEFDNSIHKLVYNEGVYPTQGVRPVFTSIHQIIKSKISLFYTEIFLKKLDVDKLLFSVIDGMLQCRYLQNEQTVYRMETSISSSLGKARRNKKDDLQAITAVHESGHAVLSLILLKTIPNVIYSVTADTNSQGFMHSRLAWKYISRKELLPRVALMLGGYAAEELIFGKENLTSGASGDIKKATAFLSKMYKYEGMGQTPINYGIRCIEEKDTYHRYDEVEMEIKQVMEEARKLAEATLIKEKRLLLALADYLSDHRMLHKNEIKRIAENTITGKVDFIEDGDFLFYRDHLKQQVKDYQVSKPFSQSHFMNTISLNKKQ
jgi:hypothetical protein